MMSIWEWLFYGHFFIALCAVALQLETRIQLGLDPLGIGFYALGFGVTFLFYHYPYLRMNTAGYTGTHPRFSWYIRHQKTVQTLCLFIALACLLLTGWLGMTWGNRLSVIPGMMWAGVALFPLLAVLYYGGWGKWSGWNLRRIGWLKPFVLGMVWAGMVNVFPLVADALQQDTVPQFSLRAVMLFVKNGMFISMIAILFDIKDYSQDARSRINTLIVRFGLRNTLMGILIPLTTLGLLVMIAFAVAQGFDLLTLVFLMVPFFLLMGAAFSFSRRRSPLYYLVVIDGLLMVKALMGILSVWVAS